MSSARKITAAAAACTLAALAIVSATSDASAVDINRYQVDVIHCPSHGPSQHIGFAGLAAASQREVRAVRWQALHHSDTQQVRLVKVVQTQPVKITSLISQWTDGC